MSIRIQGPSFDRLLENMNLLFEKAVIYLDARTAESRINAHITQKEQELLRSEIKKKDEQLRLLQSRIDKGGAAPGRKRRPRPDNRRDQEGHKKADPQNTQNGHAAFNGIKGLEKLKDTPSIEASQPADAE